MMTVDATTNRSEAPQKQGKEQLLIYESTRCRVERFWPECQVWLYEDRLEVKSPQLVRRTISTDQITFLASGRFLWNRHLIVRFSEECELKELRLQSFCPGMWYDALEAWEVPTEDKYDFRGSKQITQRLLRGLGWIVWLIGLGFVAALTIAAILGTK